VLDRADEKEQADDGSCDLEPLPHDRSIGRAPREPYAPDG
jgi:hypothetical protein